jgi:hypothetical protein
MIPDAKNKLLKKGNLMNTNTLTIDKTKRKEVFILIFCLLIAFAFRFYTFDKKSLWLDEIYTFNDSRDDFRGQIKFYKDNPTFLHPPLFFILTHQFYPFTKPERDLRIIPFIFGALSIPMIYLLARQFSSSIALPCTLSLAFMTYHIYISQDGRSYSMLMFLGITGLYFFIRHLKTSQKRYLLLVALCFSLSFLTSYSSIPFISLVQVIWFYRPDKAIKKPTFSCFLLLNILILLFCLPWITFLLVNYKGQTLMDPFHIESPGSLGNVLYGIFYDWVPFNPLMTVSLILFILFPFVSKNKINALILVSVLIGPIAGLLLFCKLLKITHFVTSRYFISFLPLFFITLYLSLDALQLKFGKLKRFIRLEFLFVILFIASNLILLPLYYYHEKQDFRGLSNYLKVHLIEGDNIFDWNSLVTPGILHYFGIFPKGRQYVASFKNDPIKGFEFKKSFIYQNKTFNIYHSTTCCMQYITEGRRLWIIVVGRSTAKQIQDNFTIAFKGYFDGSFLSTSRFPTDASLYLFLLDPRSPYEKGIEIPIE